MSALKTVIFTAITIGAIYIGIKLNNFFDVTPPKLEETWWGSGKPSKTDESIQPFKINVSEKVLEDLKYRLDNTRQFTPPLVGIQQQYGINTNLLQEVLDFWKTKYNWKEREIYLNKYPQFTTNIQGLDIHFIHVKPKSVPSDIKILPLLLLHGWPGSIREFYETIPILTVPSEETKKYGFIFEVVVPSLPGYGFSQASVIPGFGPSEISLVMKNLMKRVGFDKFYVQGGDWGALIASHMSTLFPNHVLGVHSNMCVALTPMSFLKHLLGSLYPPLIVEEKYQNRLYPLSKHIDFVLLESGYMHIQTTKPDTIGVALNDSPAGLAAYILEKVTTGTNPQYKERADGGLKLKFSYTNLLDNVMIYWVTNTMTTAMRLYAEGLNKSQLISKVNIIPVTVPYACAKFPHEIVYMTDGMLSSKYKNLVYSGYYDDGGHFAALEVPKLLANDIWAAIEKMEEFYVQIEVKRE